MAQNNQLAGWPLGSGADQGMAVYSTTTAVGANLVVKYDTSNVGGPSLPRGVIITSDDTLCIGVTVDALAVAPVAGVPGPVGRVRRAGMAVCTASATIHVGQYLMSDSAGKVLPHTAGKYQIGIADSEAVSGDLVNVWLEIAKNA